MLTSGTLAALQEVLASWFARDRSKHGHYVTSRVPKMAIYGAFISAPLGHVLISLLQRVFSGRTSLKAKILQILVSNLIVRFLRLSNPLHLRSWCGRYGNKYCMYCTYRSPRFKTPSISPRWPSSRVHERCIRSAPPSERASCPSCASAGSPLRWPWPSPRSSCPNRLGCRSSTSSLSSSGPMSILPPRRNDWRL